MEIVLDPRDIERDDLYAFDTFLDNLKLRDLLAFQCMINTVVDSRTRR